MSANGTVATDPIQTNQAATTPMPSRKPDLQRPGEEEVTWTSAAAASAPILRPIITSRILRRRCQIQVEARCKVYLRTYLRDIVHLTGREAVEEGLRGEQVEEAGLCARQLVDRLLDNPIVDWRPSKGGNGQKQD